MHATGSFGCFQLLVLPSEGLVAICSLGCRVFRTHNVCVVLFFKSLGLLLQYDNKNKRQYNHEKRNQPINTDHARPILGAIAQVLPVDVVRSASVRDFGEPLEDELLL